MEDVLDADILDVCLANDDDSFFNDVLRTLQTGDANETTTDASSPDHDAPAPRTKKRQRTSLRDEILHLRAKHDALTAQLDALVAKSAAVSTASSPSFWAGRAKNQAVAAQETLHENARLQELLRDQLRTIATLQRAFARKPKLCDFPCVAPWKMASLGTTGRREAKAKLLQHQRTQLETEWIRHRLDEYHARCDSVQTHYAQSVGDALYVHFVECHSWSLDVDAVAGVVWGLLTRQLTREPQIYVTSEAEVDDDNTTYFRFAARILGPSLPLVDGRLLAGRFVEADRVVFVTRSILDDALYPTDPSHFVDNQCGWIVVQRVDDATTRLTSYARFTPPMVSPDSTITDFSPGMYTDCVLQLVEKCGVSLHDMVQSVLDDAQ
ncbi:hypothetical protein SDRG_14014 [Saprolegnia diclina VS20]|uniref:START domain-containing protein n=1 Tax=Saprolegnia diclina (strain VS20) TaxID=1156394 RepID=T0Q431_SAPDV|nr:hypothetical protein SDRG_14014 [Saprolegnia diclina VS20]EQC28190.1 hypothetical protein SDRG_14014 [Saprolegnia diclina VS20]|eukprot:XP_008618339.1 hypothetical protein SDRG_14014 [Saprolegnia diclina VS20]